MYVQSKKVNFLYAILKNSQVMPMWHPSIRPFVFKMIWDWENNMKLGIYIQLLEQHIEFEYQLNHIILAYFTAKSRSNSLLCLWPQKSKYILIEYD